MTPRDTITLTDRRMLSRNNLLHLDQGVAVTSHALQGKTVDHVIVSVPVESFSQVNQAQTYVSLSRARRSMHLVTDCKAALREAIVRPSERISPWELIEQYILVQTMAWHQFAQTRERDLEVTRDR